MTQICSICNHEKRLSIDREIVAGKAPTIISRKYGVGLDSINWHKKNHISRQLSQAMQKKELQNSFHLLQKIDDILSAAQQIFQRNFEKGHDGLAIKALSEQRNTIDLLAKISWMLHEAKLAELEQARIESGEQAREQEEDFEASLKVLTTPELKILEALSYKLQTQNKKLVIIPEGENLDFLQDLDYSEQDYPFEPKGQETAEESPKFDIEPPRRRQRRTRYPDRIEK